MSKSGGQHKSLDRMPPSSDISADLLFTTFHDCSSMTPRKSSEAPSGEDNDSREVVMRKHRFTWDGEAGDECNNRDSGSAYKHGALMGKLRCT